MTALRQARELRSQLQADLSKAENDLIVLRHMIESKAFAAHTGDEKARRELRSYQKQYADRKADELSITDAIAESDRYVRIAEAEEAAELKAENLEKARATVAMMRDKAEKLHWLLTQAVELSWGLREDFLELRSKVPRMQSYDQFTSNTERAVRTLFKGSIGFAE